MKTESWNQIAAYHGERAKQLNEKAANVESDIKKIEAGITDKDQLVTDLGRDLAEQEEVVKTCERNLIIAEAKFAVFDSLSNIFSLRNLFGFGKKKKK